MVHEPQCFGGRLQACPIWYKDRHIGPYPQVLKNVKQYRFSPKSDARWSTAKRQPHDEVVLQKVTVVVRVPVHMLFLSIRQIDTGRTVAAVASNSSRSPAL